MSWEEDKWIYTWMPGAFKRLAKGGGTQGTGQSPSQTQNAQKACEQHNWIELLPMTCLKPGYEETRMHYVMVDDATRQLVRDMGGFTHVRVNYQ